MTGKSLEHDWFPEPLPDNVTIGDESWVYSSFAFRHYESKRGVSIGRHSGLYNGTFLDLGPNGRVEIGDYCSLVGVIFATNGRVVIEDYSFFAHEVLIADSSFVTPSGIAGSPDLSDPVVFVGENVWVGARAVLLAGTQLGRGSVVGAATVVNGFVPDYAIVAGNPWRIVGWAREKP